MRRTRSAPSGIGSSMTTRADLSTATRSGASRWPRATGSPPPSRVGHRARLGLARLDRRARAGRRPAARTCSAPAPARCSPATRRRSTSTSCAPPCSRPAQGAIVIDRGTFPTDRYVLDGARRAQRPRAAPGRPARAGRPPARTAALRGRSRHVDYRSGAIADMAALTAAARGLGPLPLRRRGPRRPQRRRRRPRGRLHLQVPQRRPGRARLPLRRAGPPGAAALADPGLVRPARPVRDGARLRTRRRHRRASRPARRRSSRSPPSRRACG